LSKKMKKKFVCIKVLVQKRVNFHFLIIFHFKWQKKMKKACGKFNFFSLKWFRKEERSMH
jgi:hypothetical protein